MDDPYRVELKESVVRYTSLAGTDLGDGTELVFDSKADAESWMRSIEEAMSDDVMGTFSLQTAHPNDSSDVDAYLVFRPRGRWVGES